MPDEAQHENCHMAYCVIGLKQTDKPCAKRETSYQDIDSHSQQFSTLRFSITRTAGSLSPASNLRPRDSL
jgi:hypothetical protein